VLRNAGISKELRTGESMKYDLNKIYKVVTPKQALAWTVRDCCEDCKKVYDHLARNLSYPESSYNDEVVVIRSATGHLVDMHAKEDLEVSAGIKSKYVPRPVCPRCGTKRWSTWFIVGRPNELECTKCGYKMQEP